MTEATAAALATDTAMPEPVAEMTEEQELAAAFDALQEEPANEAEEPKAEEEQPEEETEADPETADEPEAAETDEEPDEPEEAEAAEDAPSELPRAVRDAWKDIPAEARDAILDRQRDLSRKLGEQGRQLQGISPIRDSLVKAVQEFPQLANMKPDQVAGEVFELARINAQFQSQPVQTLMQLVDKHGLREPLKQVLTGEQPQQTDMRENALLSKISHLERQLEQVANPEYIQQNVQQFTQQAQVESQVNEFAQTAEHWADVEDKMPAAIQFVQGANPGLPAQDALKRAYDLAVSQFVPEAAQAPKPAAPVAAPVSDPQRTEAAIKAKSVNVKGKASDKTRSLTEEEELSRVFDKMQD